jgi:hypothetical protein
VSPLLLRMYTHTYMYEYSTAFWTEGSMPVAELVLLYPKSPYSLDVWIPSSRRILQVLSIPERTRCLQRCRHKQARVRMAGECWIDML